MPIFTVIPFVFLEANISGWLWTIAFIALIAWMAALDE